MLVAIRAGVYRGKQPRLAEPWSNTDHDNTSAKHRLYIAALLLVPTLRVHVRGGLSKRREGVDTRNNTVWVILYHEKPNWVGLPENRIG